MPDRARVGRAPSPKGPSRVAPAEGEGNPTSEPGRGDELEETEERPAAHGPRRLGREMALQMLYQHDLARSAPAQIFQAFDLRDFSSETSATRAEGNSVDEQLAREKEAFLYARRLVSGTLDHLEEIDGWLREQAENWRIERMSTVDRNILRLAVFELAYEHDVPKVVVLDEAIELAKKFGTEQSGSFVNGILDALLRERRFPGRLT